MYYPTTWHVRLSRYNEVFNFDSLTFLDLKNKTKNKKKS